MFSQSQVQYLRFLFSEKGVSASADKVKAIENYPTPDSAIDVRIFLGLVLFYGRLVPNFAEVAKPVKMLTLKSQELNGARVNTRHLRILKIGFVRFLYQLIQISVYPDCID